MTVSTAFIRANLQHFGIQDMAVVARNAAILDSSLSEVPYVLTEEHDQFIGDDQGSVIRGKMVSELCGIRDYSVLTQYIFADGVEPRSANQLGWIDSGRQFSFSAASDLRTCLGWAIATDGGHKRNLSHVNLDAEVQRLSAALAAMPITFLRPQLAASPEAAEEDVREFFFGNTWSGALKQVMRYDDTSRFGDGDCGVKTLLWQVGTRTLLGKEHPGFPFAY